MSRRTSHPWVTHGAHHVHRAQVAHGTQEAQYVMGAQTAPRAQKARRARPSLRPARRVVNRIGPQTYTVLQLVTASVSRPRDQGPAGGRGRRPGSLPGELDAVDEDGAVAGADGPVRH